MPDFIQELHRLLPASRRLIPDLFSVTADNIFRALSAGQVDFRIERTTEGDWDVEQSAFEDLEIFDAVGLPSAGHEGEVLMVTEACSRYGLRPFSCQADALRSFVDDYDLEMFFDGDVVIVAPRSRTMTIFHHEGAYCTVSL